MAKLKKRADGRYQANVIYDGKRYSVYARSAAALTQKKLEKLQQLQTQSRNRENPILDKYYKVFTELRRSKVKESTLRCQGAMYQNCAGSLLDGKRFGDLRIRDITPKDCQLVQQNLIAKGFSSRTVNDTMKHLSHVFNCAVKDETIDRNPCRAIEHLRRTEPAARDTIHRALSVDETARFFEAASGSSFLNCYKLMIQTGLRIGELCALYPSDMDVQNNCLHITKTVTRDEIGLYMIGDSTKTYAGTRDIPLNDVIIAIINAQMLTNRMLMMISPLLFPAADGKILREYTVNRDIRRICEKNDIQVFTCHAFRATFATRFIEQRPQDYKILSEILGHADTKITLNLYTHVMKENKESAMTGITIAM